MTIIKTGTRHTAPEYFDNATGAASWSGMRVDEMSAQQAIEILEFCEQEGWRQGWNAEHRADPLDLRSNPFHPDFLRGHPYRWWDNRFQEGREAYRHEQSQKPSQADDGNFY